MTARTTLCTLISMASLLIGTSAVAWSGNGYNIHYGKGASFSKGTMMRNATGASPRVGSGRSSYSRTRTATPKRSFGTIKLQSSTVKIHRIGKGAGLRHLSIDHKLLVTGRNSIRLIGGGWTKDSARAAVEKLGGKLVTAKSENGHLAIVHFKGKPGSLLKRLGGIVHRINRKPGQKRKASRRKKVSYGANLKATLLKQLKLKPGTQIIYRTTKVKSYGKRSSYTQRRKGMFWVNMSDGKTTSHRGTLDFMVTRSGKVRALKGTKADFVRKSAPHVKANEPAAVKQNLRSPTKRGGGGATPSSSSGTSYGGNPEAYARGLQANLW